MINRGKKLRLIQFTLLIVGIIIVLFTYLGNNKSANKNLLKIPKKKIESNQKEGSCGYSQEAPGGKNLKSPGGTQGMDANKRTVKMMRETIKKQIKRLYEQHNKTT